MNTELMFSSKTNEWATPKMIERYEEFKAEQKGKLLFSK